MPSCPHCNNPVDWLVHTKSMLESFVFKVSGGVVVHGDEPVDTRPVDVIEEYSCPTCFETLATTEEAAKEFLMQGAPARVDVPYLK